MQLQYPYCKYKVNKTKKLWRVSLMGEVLSSLSLEENALPTTIKAFTAKHMLSNHRACRVL